MQALLAVCHDPLHRVESEFHSPSYELVLKSTRPSKVHRQAVAVKGELASLASKLRSTCASAMNILECAEAR